MFRVHGLSPHFLTLSACARVCVCVCADQCMSMHATLPDGSGGGGGMCAVGVTLWEPELSKEFSSSLSTKVSDIKTLTLVYGKLNWGNKDIDKYMYYQQTF